MNNSNTNLFDILQNIIQSNNYNDIIKNNDNYHNINNLCNTINSKILEKRYKYNNNKINFRSQSYKNNNKIHYKHPNNNYNKNKDQYHEYSQYNYNSYNTESTNNNYFNESRNNTDYKYKKYSKYNNEKNTYINQNTTNNYNNTESVFLSLNKNLNIISTKNFDTVYGNVLEAIGMYIVNYINNYMENYNKFLLKFKSDESLIQVIDFKQLQNDINNFVSYIIYMCVKKSIIDFNNFNIYFKFINTLLKLNIGIFNKNIQNRIYQFVNKIIETNNIFITSDNKEFIETLNLKNKAKTELLLKEIKSLVLMDVIIEKFITNIKINSLKYLKNDYNETEHNIIDKLRNYLETTVKYTQKNKVVNLNLSTFSNDIIYQLMGYFNKYYNNFHKSSINKLFTEYLVGIYDNFKRINELLIWEPINIIELENRIYFTIGFLHNNKQFIKILDYDLYQDIESELETIKKSNNIPVSVKYKLLDTIDNFIQNRLS